jgi:hypothetical protein
VNASAGATRGAGRGAQPDERPALRAWRGSGVVFDSASPGSGLDTLGFDKIFESFEIFLDSPGDYPKAIGNIFRESFRLVFHLKHDSSLLIGQGVKGHDAGLRCSREAPPGDPLVGYLFGDFGVKYLFFAADIGAPARSLFVQLTHLLDTAHKPWKFFKLSPLVIGLSGGHFSIDFSIVVIVKLLSLSVENRRLLVSGFLCLATNLPEVFPSPDEIIAQLNDASFILRYRSSLPK